MSDKAKANEQVNFRATPKALESIKLAENEMGRAEFINKAIEYYGKRRRKGAAYFALEEAYRFMTFTWTPEAEAVTRAIRDILWRRGDLPTSVIAYQRKKNGSSSQKYFSDLEKAMILSMEDSDCVSYEIYGLDKEPLAAAVRGENNCFSFTLPPPSIPPISIDFDFED